LAAESWKARPGVLFAAPSEIEKVGILVEVLRKPAAAAAVCRRLGLDEDWLTYWWRDTNEQRSHMRWVLLDAQRKLDHIPPWSGQGGDYLLVVRRQEAALDGLQELERLGFNRDERISLGR
jgi:hypothetical protein